MAFKFLKDILASASELIRPNPNSFAEKKAELPTQELMMGDFIGDFGKGMRRTHHKWIHPTKGWRGEHSVHGGTNRRRGLSAKGRELLDAH